MSFGKIIQSGEGRFQWIISDFLSTVILYSVSYAQFIDSPPFIYLNGTYQLQMRVTTKGAEEIGLILFELRPSSSHGVSVSLRMRTGPRGRVEIRCGKIPDGKMKFEVRRWMSPHELLQRRSEILDCYGNFTVLCDLNPLDAESNTEVAPQLLKIETNDTAENRDDCVENIDPEFEEEEERVSQKKSRNKMIEDMKLLLAGDEDCDVVLKVQGKEFPVHKIILKTRSPVFKSMFSHDSAESQSGEVIISDCDPATFPDFLTYVYTGSSRHISAENACSLYTTADKYCLDTLKEECLLFMMNNLSVDSFCDFLTLALQREEKELVELAIGFFCVNTVAIIKTVKWQKFLQENATVGNELFLKVATK